MCLQGRQSAFERRPGRPGKYSAPVHGYFGEDRRLDESIYGCGKAGMEKPDTGRITRKGNKLYYHLFENTVGPMPLLGLKKEEVDHVRYLATGAEVPLANTWASNNYPDIVFADLGEDPVLPDPVDTVLEVTLKE